MGLIGLGLWAFALHRHLLRRLLAFNVIGTGIFLILMALVGDRNTAAGHGLVVTGLLVALLGTALGALLIRRLNRLDGRRILDVAEAGRSRA
ncbi:NADH-quinone oxidoreductase subunit K [Halomonas kenyensis]|uniref:NADH-quinone oxidoreductase subunit K n=2 Tax=Billgrantia kenyensis TaxID=321266 RepID=A0A7V9W4M9_9GAMM|nr:NADH-quinone oxidoreductase subunit K [Halomonas kenyensis]MCG6663719.1 Na+/H+ antiporter subunit C [Halomonas kenyensis]